MTTLTTSKLSSTANSTKPADDYHTGQFDAALSLPPQSQTGDYFKGYLAKVNDPSSDAAKEIEAIKKEVLEVLHGAYG